MSSTIAKMYKSRFTFFGIVVGLFFTFFYYFPDFYAGQVAPAGAFYSGNASWFDPWDINVYISAIKWSQHSSNFFQNAYTTIPHKPFVLYPFYTLLGKLLPNIGAVALFTTSKIVLGFILAMAIYFSSSLFLKNKNESLLATFLICLGGGFGWIFYKFSFLPDLVITPFTFSATFQRPHEMFAVIFYLTSLGFLYRGVVEKKKAKIITSAALFNFVIIFYPYYLLTFFLISLAFLLNQFGNNLRKAFEFFLLIILYSLPFGIIYSLYLLNSQAFESVISPNLTFPDLISLALGYGVLTPIFIYQLLKEPKDKRAVFLNFWLIISLATAHLPVDFSKYYLRGLFFPLVLISFVLLPKIGKILKLKKYLLIGLFAFFLVPTSLLVFWKRTVPSQTALEWYYLSQGQKEAVEFLNQESLTGQGVLAPYPLANWLPAHTNNRVYFGHYHQTPNSEDKLRNQNKFYSGEYEDNEAREFLQENYIKYIWCENEECKLDYSFLIPVFENEEVDIYSY